MGLSTPAIFTSQRQKESIFEPTCSPPACRSAQTPGSMGERSSAYIKVTGTSSSPIIPNVFIFWKELVKRILISILALKASGEESHFSSIPPSRVLQVTIRLGLRVTPTIYSFPRPLNGADLER